eukprot:scaffold440638_cov19-Prasinocladus_malaysianus.AAC.1
MAPILTTRLAESQAVASEGLKSGSDNTSHNLRSGMRVPFRFNNTARLTRGQDLKDFDAASPAVQIARHR